MEDNKITNYATAVVMWAFAIGISAVILAGFGWLVMRILGV